MKSQPSVFPSLDYQPIQKLTRADQPLNSSHRAREKQLLRIVRPVDFFNGLDHDLECRIGHGDNSCPEFLFFFLAKGFSTADLYRDGIQGLLSKPAFLELDNFTQ